MAAKTNEVRLVFLICLSVFAAGCKGGGDSSSSSTSTQASPLLHSGSGSSASPQISGTAAGAVKAGATYSFAPTASDPEGDALSFQIANKPSWATFNTLNGQLSGSPTLSQVGTYADIVISVSDGTHSSSLPAFTISVSDTSAKSVSLSWTAPTQNVDGSALTNLAGFMVSYGTSRAALSNTVRIDNPSVDRHLFENLSAGTYYFGIRAYSSNGAESSMSAIVSKVVK
jgi:Putative Ig domain